MKQTLTAYQHLKNNFTRKDIGCTLPTLQSASLNIRSQLMSHDGLKDCLNHWANATGWYQTNDATTLGMPEHLNTLLEGEWFDGQNSLSVRLIGPDQYQVTELSIDDDGVIEGYCYQEQDIYLRAGICKSKGDAVRYRQWFQSLEHAWQPVASQFVGFTFTEEQQ